MDLTCIGHKTISHLQGGHGLECLSSQGQILWGFYLEPATAEQFGFACPKVIFLSSNWDVLEAASAFRLGSVTSLALDDSAARARANNAGPFLMLVRTMLSPKTWLANLGYFPFSRSLQASRCFKQVAWNVLRDFLFTTLLWSRLAPIWLKL